MPVGTQRGGAERQLQQLVDFRSIAGLELTIVFLEDGALPGWCRERGVEAVVVPAGRTRDLRTLRRAVGRIAAVGRRARAEVVVGWMPKAHLYGGPAAL